MSKLDVLRGQLPAEILAELEATVTAPTYTDTSGTPGSGTASTISGRSAIAIGASAATITNTLCAATDIVLCQLESLDASLVRLKAVPGAGSFVVTGNTTATAATKFRWYLIKTAG